MWCCDCGGYFDVVIDTKFPIDKISKRPPNMWRYREALPQIENKNIVSMGEGFTPLIKFDDLGKNVFIKQEHLFPSGSYKDRGASMMISKIKQLGIKKVVEDSSGNAGSAVAAYCAWANINCDILVPENTSKGKLVQIKSYGANLRLIPGSREKTSLAAFKEAENTYYASHSYNPYFLQGTKTFSYEVTEQLNWKAPDILVLPVGNGTLLLGAYLGFNDLYSSGIIRKIPKIIAIQSKNCAPLADLFNKKILKIEDFKPQNTIAEGIAIANPLRQQAILAAVRNTAGMFITVEEDEIITSLKSTHKKGFFIEPTSAATIAGLKKYMKLFQNNDMVISAFTGSGLKATAKIDSIFKE